MHEFKIGIPSLESHAPVDKPVRVIGIDLGTTNSAVVECVLQPNGQVDSRVLPITQRALDGWTQEKLLPSAVAYWMDEICVGRVAVQLRGTASERDLQIDRDLFFECKNDIGTRRTYPRAPKALRDPTRVSAVILKALAAAAQDEGANLPTAETIVTVPASFQLAQRRETREAAAQAGLDVSDDGLLDEPVAAFIDYLLKHGEICLPEKDVVRLVVFDFGGGTCDVAVFELFPRQEGEVPAISSRAVSRYHRLGGGDIDRAIVHDVLIPQLAQQNNVSLQDLDYETKAQVLEPALLSTAERLKKKLCKRLSKVPVSERHLRSADHERPPVTLEDCIEVYAFGRMMQLAAPTLCVEQFEALLEPFLDQDLLYARETEYRLTASIFGPLQDALDRSGLKPADMDLCLAVGGSSLIPQVSTALKNYFKNARLLMHDSVADTQLAVVRGAAYHALYTLLAGERLIPATCHDGIALKTDDGPLVLIPRGAAIPYPGADWQTLDGRLRVPHAIVQKYYRMGVMVVAGKEKRPVFTQEWQMDERVAPGDGLCLRYRMDANQCLYLELSVPHLAGGPAFECIIENPLTHVVNPSETRMAIQEKEEIVETQEAEGEADPEELVQLAELHAKVDQYERAMSLLQKASQKEPDRSRIPLLMGLYADSMGNLDRAGKLYKEAARLDLEWGTPHFNWALALQRKGKTEEALEAIDQALEREREPEYLTLKAQILNRQEKKTDMETCLQQARKLYGLPCLMSNWTLGWYMTALEMQEDDGELQVAREERKRRDEKRINICQTGCLPHLVQEPVTQDEEFMR